MMRNLSRWLLMTAALLACSCAPSWTVVKQAPPGTFPADAKFSILDTSAGGASVDAEEVKGLSLKLAATAAVHSDGSGYMEISAPSGCFFVRPVLDRVSGGGGEPYDFHLTVQIKNPGEDGVVLDEFQVSVRIDHVVQRYQIAGEQLGKIIGAYLSRRIKP